MSKSDRTDGSERRIELVALIDVIFLLLIFFLVTLNISAALGGSDDLEGTYGIEMMDNEHKAGGKTVIVVIPLRNGEITRDCFLQFNGISNYEDPDLNFAELADWIRAIMRGDGSIPAKIDDIRMRLEYSIVESALYENSEYIAASLKRNRPDKAVILCGGGTRFGAVHGVIRVCRKEGVSKHEVVTLNSFDQVLDQLSMMNLDLEGRIIRKDG